MGREGAREPEPVGTVEPKDVAAVLGHVSEDVAAMIRLQELTGMRPGEVVRMRRERIAMDGEVWSYKPERHKTEHHNKKRVIALGPQAQDILRGYVLKRPDGYLFHPRVRPPKSGRYSVDRYGREIARACA